MKLIAAVCLCLALLLASPVQGAQLITPSQNVELAMTVANGALQSKDCAALYAKEFPKAPASAIQIFTTDVWITIIPFDNVVIDSDYIAVVMPIVNAKRIMVNELFAGVLLPVTLGETLIHEFFHLSDYAFGTNESLLLTEENSQLRAKACMDSLWKAYPDAKPEGWEDGPRPLKEKR